MPDGITDALNRLWEQIDALQGLTERGDVKRELALAKTHLEDAASRVHRAAVIGTVGAPGATV